MLDATEANGWKVVWNLKKCFLIFGTWFNHTSAVNNLYLFQGVAIADISEEGGNHALSTLTNTFGDKVIFIKTDVSNAAEFQGKVIYIFSWVAVDFVIFSYLKSSSVNFSENKLKYGLSAGIRLNPLVIFFLVIY